jgi:hypothetical protein
MAGGVLHTLAVPVKQPTLLVTNVWAIAQKDQEMLIHSYEIYDWIFEVWVIPAILGEIAFEQTETSMKEKTCV